VVWMLDTWDRRVKSSWLMAEYDKEASPVSAVFPCILTGGVRNEKRKLEEDVVGKCVKGREVRGLCGEDRYEAGAMSWEGSASSDNWGINSAPSSPCGRGVNE
jgi:hypothetical protein